MSRSRRLWAKFKKQDGRCHWCGEKMIEPNSFKPAKGVSPPAMLCTVDHLDTRISPERGTRQGQIRTVAACYSCNNGRDIESQKLMPADERAALSIYCRFVRGLGTKSGVSA